jgi:hypothetical protein
VSTVASRRAALSSNPRWKGLCADSEEKHEPASDIDSLKALDPDPPIREADIHCGAANVRFGPIVLQKSFCILDHKISEP